MRRSASRARAWTLSASRLATTAATRKTPSATQFPSLATVKRPVGGRWKKLNAAALATAVATPNHIPHRIESSRTASR